jgi:protein dithiol oxidoreductase (disulfide-forming)
MPKRLSLVCAALLMLSACSSNNGDSAAPATPAPTAASTTAAPGTAATPAQAATAAAPTAAGSAASAPAAVDPSIAADRAEAAAKFVDDGTFVEGKHYQRIDPAQPTVTNSGKIEVVEVFSYGCPACNAFHDWMDKLSAAMPKAATVVYLPASFVPQENWPALQRVYYTAQALGVDAKGHDAMYDAVWKSGELGMMDLRSERPKPQAAWPQMENFAKFYAQYGANPDEFIATANSFSINTKMKRADELIKAYGVESTPTIVVNGKYRFSPKDAGSYEQTIKLTQFLVGKEAAGK